MSENDFEKVWELQQGALFLKQDQIYALKKNLAEYFYRKGYEQSQKELDKYQDKVYHSTRLIEQLEHELELLRKVVQLQREGLEKIAAIKTLGDINLYVFYKELDKQDLEEMCLDDTELARYTLKEVDELLKGEK